jgi:REP element-mobilizing transposase RayT
VPGNNGEHILEGEEKEKYIKYILKYKERYKFSIYAYCIMSNHVHLLLETGETPLSKIMQGIQQSFTQYYNKKYKRTGHVFRTRYKALLCNKESYLLQLIKYIHKNPVEAGFDQGLNYDWSSHKCYLSGENDSLVDVSFALSMLSNDPVEARKEYLRLISADAEEEGPFDTYLEAIQKECEQQKDSVQPIDTAINYITACNENNKMIRFDEIMDEVCNEAGVDVEDVLRRSRIKKYSDIRKAIVRLCDKYSNITRRDLQ